MSVSVSLPEVFLLRTRVESVYGHTPQTHNAFIDLVDSVEAALHEHLSESTLERLWGYSTRGADSVSLRTLDVLSRYVGASSWRGFCADLKASAKTESEEFAGDSVVSASIEKGKCLQLGWLPDRLITVEYLGSNRFVVIESLNSSLKPGDSFECIQIQEGRPMYLDRFRRADSNEEARYVVGERSGLTLVKLL